MCVYSNKPFLWGTRTALSSVSFVYTMWLPVPRIRSYEGQADSTRKDRSHKHACRLPATRWRRRHLWGGRGLRCSWCQSVSILRVWTLFRISGHFTNHDHIQFTHTQQHGRQGDGREYQPRGSVRGRPVAGRPPRSPRSAPHTCSGCHTWRKTAAGYAQPQAASAAAASARCGAPPGSRGRP